MGNVMMQPSLEGKGLEVWFRRVFSAAQAVVRLTVAVVLNSEPGEARPEGRASAIAINVPTD